MAKYNKQAVQAEINKDKSIGSKEAKLIHGLLKGATVENKSEDKYKGVITVHCVECGSQDIEEINGVRRWDVEKQKWDMADSPIGYMYECKDCGEESGEYSEALDGETVSSSKWLWSVIDLGRGAGQ